MKFLHISDLHIGKIVNGFPMLEEQKYVLGNILEVAETENVKGIIIAGDIYNKSIPSVDAIDVFDDFVTKLSEKNISSYIVSGNHDSVQRVSFGASIMAKNNIHFAKSYNGKIEPIMANDEEKIAIWLLPFVRPTDVRPYHSEEISCGRYQDAVAAVVKNMDIDKSITNILVAHQFVTNNGVPPSRSESENSSLGTLDNVDYSVFDDFDYVALGHIHNPQSMGRKTVRYAGSPLKYSFSEINQKKAITVLDIHDKKIEITQIPIKPIHDFKELKGSFKDIMMQGCNDYVHITLTDDLIMDVKNRLETVFPNIMLLDYDNASTREKNSMVEITNLKQKNIFEHFADFYYLQNNKELNETETEIVNSVIEELGGAQ
ncbi:MAG: exonuclease SbcCD subunit D [Candidatus Gastranaerophilales bacterium]|nr:exonuclease SbcCD subunit D [Candidatus Gastranaerophilales bacterium]